MTIFVGLLLLALSIFLFRIAPQCNDKVGAKILGVIFLVGAMAVPVATYVGQYSHQIEVAESYTAQKVFVRYCEDTSREMATDYPQPLQLQSDIVLQDSQNADTASMSIQTRMECLAEAGRQAERQATLNCKARNIMNWPIRGVLSDIRDSALRPWKEKCHE